MRKIKILFIHHGIGVGGAPISLLNLINHLDSERFHCKVAFVKNSQVVDLFKKNGIETQIIGSSNVWFSHNESGKIQWRFFYKYWEIYKHWKRTAYCDAPKFLATQDFDILHLNSHVLSSWAVAGQNMGKKVVLHNREAISKGYFGFRYKILKSIIEKNCDSIINISYDNYNRLGLEKNSSVVYNFITIPSSIRQSIETEKQSYKVLYLGGMAKIKGFETVVSCLAYLNKGITVQFAGNYMNLGSSESFKKSLIKIAKHLMYYKKYKMLKNLLKAENAEFLGLLKDPLDYIDKCDVLITPFSITHFSRPAIEAMAYAKPVIGTDVEGMDEIIDHNINGLIVEKNNPKVLAHAINYLAENPNHAKSMGLKGREKAIQMFSPEPNIKKIENIYQNLFDTKNSG